MNINQKSNISEIFDNFHQGSIERIKLDLEDGRTVTNSQAGTESESTKDYVGRVAFEFFQNAVDRSDGNIWLELTNNEFIILNDGKPFSIYEREDKNQKKSDFHSLNSIHDGSKVAGESIGNKGVGFKSCWNVSEHVIIESVIEHKDKEDEYWGFELFNPIKSDYFNDEKIKAVINETKSIPSFYFPQQIESKKENFKYDAVTKITIKFTKDNEEASYKEIKEELEEFQRAYFIFLNQLKDKENKEFQIHIKIDGVEKEPLNSKDDNFKIVSLKKEYEELFDELRKARLEEDYKNIPDKPNIAIAFPLNDLEDFDAKFYTYLPTEAECGFNILIHADFALDNARKHIPSNKYNDKILKIAATMFVNELLTNTELHKRADFAKFLIPKDRNEEFAQLVWNELTKDNNLTKILKKVFTFNSSFAEEAYEIIFSAIEQWTKEHTHGKVWTEYYISIYQETIQYFCDEEAYIVWIDSDNKTFLPQRKEGQKYRFHLFHKNDKDDTEQQTLDFSLLKEIKKLKISTFQPLSYSKFQKNDIVRKFSTLEIIRTLNDYESLNIIKFISQLLDNTKEEFSSVLKEELKKIKLPIKDGSFKEVKYCYINISEEIRQLFNDNFAEVAIDKLYEIEKLEDFLTKIGVANNKLPGNEELPFKDNCEFPKSNLLKQFINKSLSDLNENAIEKLQCIKWFYDERKRTLYEPNEVFLFKKHDNRKINILGQEKKNSDFDELYIKLDIKEIEDTKNITKVVKQLKKMKNKTINETINKEHQDIYKKLTYQLSQLYTEEQSFDIPILTINIKEKLPKYIDQEEIHKTVFLETKYKQYINELTDLYDYLAYFDTNISHNFLENVLNIQVFNPDYEIVYKNGGQECNSSDIKPDDELKNKLQKIFLAPFFALADEILGSSFEKDDAIQRWNNLVIKKADNVVLIIKDKNKPITVGSTEEKDVDVLYIPIKDRSNKPTHIGEVAHDLSDPINNQNLRKFAQIFAEGIFRNQKLKSDFELYISGNKTLRKDILTNKGVEDNHIEQMKIIIQQSLLSETSKKNIVETMQEIGVKINNFSEISEFEKYTDIELSFKDFEKKFDEKYQSIISNLIDEYKNYIHNKTMNNISRNEEELKVLCFIKYGNRKKFEEKYNEQKKRIITSFKNEIDIYKLFKVEKLDKNGDKYVEGKIDYEYFTEDVNPKKINFIVQSNTIEAKVNPSTGDAKQSKPQTKNLEERNEKVGLGQELKLSYKFAKQIKDKKVFIEIIKEEIYKNDEKLKDNKNLKNYYLNLDEEINSNDLDFAKNVIQIANNKLDGLGYDLIIPTFNEKNEVIGIKKVELKTTKRDQNIEVHFSDNEIKRALHYMDVDNWEVWLNNENNPITPQVREAIKKLQGEELPFSFTDYILTLGINK